MSENCNVDFEDVGQENEEDISISVQSCSQDVIWSTDWTIETVLNQMRKGIINLSPKFQRRNAWNTEKKSKLIESIVLGLPIPEIILAESKDKKGSYLVIDGKQRLLSLREFCSADDEFVNFKLRKLSILKELNGKDFNDIATDPNLEEYLTAFENQTIRTVVIKNWPNDNFLHTVFHRLNTGSVQLSPQELRQAVYPGMFLDYIEEYSREDKILSSKILKINRPDGRMRDVELLIRYYAFKNYLHVYKGNLKEFLDLACDDLNKRWKTDSYSIREQAKEFDESLNATIEIFGENNAFSKWVNGSFAGRFNRAVFDIMVYYLSDEKIREKALLKRDEIVEEFKNLCENDIEFLRSFESYTKDIDKTSKRFSTWGETLSKIIGMSINVPEYPPKKRSKHD